VLHAQVRDTAPLFRKQLAHDVVHILNRYYLQVGDAIAANGGHIARYDGTTISALFGIKGEDAKTKCTNAIRAALRMQKRMAVFNTYLQEHFGFAFTLDTGLHYGRMIVGHLGHPDFARVNAVGEQSLVAGAVAAANGEHQSNILATEELVNIIEGEVHFGHVSHEPLALRDREVTLYEILDFAKPDVHSLVQQSFEAVAARRQEAAATFYAKLFEIAPDVRPMFANVDIRVQGEMLMNMLAAAVRGLDRLEELKPVLQELGRRHVAYGVQIPHYAVVEACLLHTVETMAGSAFNLDVKLAWTAIYNFIAQTMIEAGVE
jgi:hemoglobin-like flavoprotein/class 3 adenylate cyclase